MQTCFLRVSSLTLSEIFQCKQQAEILKVNTRYRKWPMTLCSGGTRQNFWIKLIPQKLEGLGYSVMKAAWSQLQPFLTDPPIWQTDGWTDRQRAIAYSMLCIYMYAVAHKKAKHLHGLTSAYRLRARNFGRRASFAVHSCIWYEVIWSS